MIWNLTGLLRYGAIAVLPPERPATPDSIVRQVSWLMEPFQTKDTDDGFEARCACVGYEADHAASEVADREVKPYAQIEEEFRALDETRTIRDPVPLMARFPDYVRWAEVWRRVYQAHPRRDTPLPNCDMCDGTGVMEWPINPRGYWAAFRVSGIPAWYPDDWGKHHGVAPAPLLPEELWQGNEPGTAAALAEALRSGEVDLDYEYAPWPVVALVTPDREWKSRLVPVGVTRPQVMVPASEWLPVILPVLDAHANDWAVILECVG